VATLFVACARCGFEATLASVRTVAGFSCPRCGDRAVELLDLAPERRRVWGPRFDMAELERLYRQPEPRELTGAPW